jgi:hypothetical protein
MNKSNTKTRRHFGAKNKPKFPGGATPITGWATPFKAFQGDSKRLKGFGEKFRFCFLVRPASSSLWLVTSFPAQPSQT